MASLLPATLSNRTGRYWHDEGWWGDQGESNKCVGFAWEHWIDDAPRFHHTRPFSDPHEIYRIAQIQDEWPGEDYEGTSIRGGAKALMELGFITEYGWAFDLDTIIQAILEVGPVIVGTNWYSGMFEPDSQGFLHPTGTIEGGHAYVLNGVGLFRKRLRMKNSWGRGWGTRGRAWIGFDDFSRLLAEEGEAAIAVEVSQ